MKAQLTGFNFPILWQVYTYIHTYIHIYIYIYIYIVLGFSYILTKSGMQLLNVWFLSILKKINQKVFSGAKYIRLSVGLSPVNPLLILQVQVKDVRKVNKCDNRRRPYPNCQSHWDASEWWRGQSIEWASQSSMLKSNTKGQKSPR